MVIFDDIKNNEKIYLYAGDLKQWNMVSVEKRFELTDKKWIDLHYQNMVKMAMVRKMKTIYYLILQHECH